MEVSSGSDRDEEMHTILVDVETQATSQSLQPYSDKADLMGYALEDADLLSGLLSDLLALDLPNQDSRYTVTFRASLEDLQIKVTTVPSQILQFIEGKSEVYARDIVQLIKLCDEVKEARVLSASFLAGWAPSTQEVVEIE